MSDIRIVREYPHPPRRSDYTTTFQIAGYPASSVNTGSINR
jgi:hypothetical protein